MAEGKLIPKRLMDVRKQNQLSSKQAAALCDIDSSVFWRYEQGQSSPSRAVIKHIAIMLGTSSSYLCGETEDSAPEALVIDISHESNNVRTLITKFSALNEKQKKLIFAIIDQFK